MTAVGDGGSSTTRSSAPFRRLAALGWALAVGVFVLVGWVFPDDGLTSSSLRQAVAVAAVFFVPPTIVWLSQTKPRRVVVAGGGWFAAGVVTLLGGNALMLVAVGYGLLLLYGLKSKVSLTVPLIWMMAAMALVLIVAMLLSIGTA